MSAGNSARGRAKVVEIKSAQRKEQVHQVDVAARPEPRTTLYARLADELKQQILQGVFKAGQKLPSVRALSQTKKMSISTVQEAYRHLEDGKWIVVRSQSGAYVARTLPEMVHTEFAEHSVVIRHISDTGPASALAYREDLIPFGAAIPDDAFFPCQRLAHGIANLLRKKPRLVGKYNFAPGTLELRQQIARRAVSWGAAVDPRRVVITNGAVEALTLCLRAVTKPGDIVAVESPAFYGFLQAAQSLGLQALPIAGDPGKGIDVNALDAAARHTKIAAIILSTTVSNPTGQTMPLDHKRRLVEVAAMHQIPVVEDATFADLQFQGEYQAAQGFDATGLVMLCASLTKTVAPGMRIGWVDGGRFSEQISYLKRISSIGQPEVMELALAEYLSNGGMESHLRRIRKAMQSRVYRMAEGIDRLFPEGTSFSLPSGGFLLWVELPEQVDSLELQEKATGFGIGVAPGALFSPRAEYRNFIRLNCAIADTAKAWEGLATLATLVAEQAAAPDHMT
ncbi:helix-turn-helix transcriptional regulator, GntR family, aminotransferase domain-containing [Paraburkholderia hospita]|uniref:Helix-turn-helix transcriptional regulator, GntR family, aminotransferase domain-containing n=1 Tax=Paraburkholderia hospita TaxID=169430 RepID=A0ABN0FTU3_9BURK|nr:aminotransferase class I/II-fold pyridoxal phosphate-dependent enzyme [Paraburkholderia hospita]EIN02197.1 helix-turn-helix transcriptional regulator, GntR family, aminotransferase domain-containing [Paraburkholderia hospita]OUL90157.1 GntR family transcriptional regulator [Paraburkholderia hospita]